jgi:hypothetical protein
MTSAITQELNQVGETCPSCVLALTATAEHGQSAGARASCGEGNKPAQVAQILVYYVFYPI